MNYPCRLNSGGKKKDYAYLWKLFNGVRTITGCFIQAEAQSDLNQPPTISLPSQAIISPALPNSLYESWYLDSKRIKRIFSPDHVTASSQVLRASTLDHLSLPFFHHLISHLSIPPQMDIFILRVLGVWVTVRWKWCFHCPPVVEMDFE